MGVKNHKNNSYKQRTKQITPYYTSVTLLCFFFWPSPLFFDWHQDFLPETNSPQLLYFIHNNHTENILKYSTFTLFPFPNDQLYWKYFIKTSLFKIPHLYSHMIAFLCYFIGWTHLVLDDFTIFLTWLGWLFSTELMQGSIAYSTAVHSIHKLSTSMSSTWRQFWVPIWHH